MLIKSSGIKTGSVADDSGSVAPYSAGISSGTFPGFLKVQQNNMWYEQMFCCQSSTN